MGQQNKPTQVVNSGNVEPSRHSGWANTGAGGVISQLRRVGNTIESPVKVMFKPNVPNIIIPPDEIKNVMAPLNWKKTRKKGTHQSKLVVSDFFLI